jgi:hypothetical protein
MLTGPRLPIRASLDGRTLRPRGFSDDARALLEHVWALMGMPCGKYLVVMLDLWLPLLVAAGDLDKPFATEATLAELNAMSAATVDRYLKPARDRMRIKGISTTKPSALLRNRGRHRGALRPDTDRRVRPRRDHHPHLRRRGTRGPRGK